MAPLAASIIQSNPKIRWLIIESLKGGPYSSAPAIADIMETSDSSLNLSPVPFSVWQNSPIGHIHERLYSQRRVVVCLNPQVASNLAESLERQGLSALVASPAKDFSTRVQLDDLLPMGSKSTVPVTIYTGDLLPSFVQLNYVFGAHNSNPGLVATAMFVSDLPVTSMDVSAFSEGNSNPRLAEVLPVPALVGNLICLQMTRDELLEFTDTEKVLDYLEGLLAMAKQRSEFFGLVVPPGEDLSSAMSWLRTKLALSSQNVEGQEDEYLESQRRILRFNSYAQRAVRPASSSARIALIVQPIDGGGLVKASEELAQSLSYLGVKAVFANSSGGYLTFRGQAKPGGSQRIPVLDSVPFSTHSNQSHDSALANLAMSIGAEWVIYEHMARQSLSSAKLIRSLGIRTITNVHDFYLSCASHTLLDEFGRFCGGKCTSGSGSCNATNWPQSEVSNLKNLGVHRHRENTRDFLRAVDMVVAPSRSALELLTKSLENESFSLHSSVVIQHSLPSWTPITPGSGRSHRILVLGDIGIHKGALLLRDLSPALLKAGYEVHFVGKTPPALKALGKHHGEYLPDDLPEITSRIRADFALLPSAFPETYSFVLSELLWSGHPVIASEIGALSERLEGQQFALLVHDFRNPISWLAAVDQFGQDGRLALARRSLAEWQSSQRVGKHRHTANWGKALGLV